MFNVDVVTLLSYDQVQFSDSNRLSIFCLDHRRRLFRERQPVRRGTPWSTPRCST